MADVITRLRIESGEYDSKIKRATQGLLQMEQECRKVGGTLSTLEKDQKEFVRSLGQMQTVSQYARGKVAELSAAYTELRVQYNRLTDAEKKGDFGKALSSSLSQLKTRITEGKNELDSISRELGNVKASSLDAKSVIQELGSRFGISSDLLSSLTTGTVAYTAAIGAAATAVAAATKQWAEYNAELARQDQVTTVTTGLKGDDAERMTSSIRALSRTYDVDFRDAVNAANTLMTQFGKSGDEAIQLLRDGMQGMIQGDGPKMLSMIQQYAPAFRDAGVSASQLIAVIQNSEGGIFTDQNMNAIVMGIKNIRLMTKATSDALAQLGIDGNKMSKQLSDGSLTIFDALKQVATAIQGVDSNSKAAGEVMQQVFGRQGAMAGTNLGKAIATLNTDLEQTKKQTGEVGESFVKLQQANERLEVSIRECFGYDGYQQLAQGIKTQLITALASTLELTMKIKDSWVGDVAGGFFEKMIDAALRLMGPLGSVLATLKEIAGIGGNGGGTTPSNPEVDKMLKYIGEGGTRQERQRRYGQQINSINRQIDLLGQERTRVDADGSTSYYKLSPAKQKQYREALERQKADLQRRATSAIIGSQPGVAASPITPIKTGGKGGKDTKTEQTELQKNQTKINELTQQFVDINAEASRAGKPLTEEQKKQTEEIQKQIEKLKERNGLLGLFAEQAQGRLLSNDDLKRKAEIDMQVNTKQIEDLRRQLAEIEGVTIDPKTVTITATDEALPKLREIEGITIDDKTMTVTAETADALRALQGIEGVTIDPKTVDVNANTSEAQQKIDELKAKIAELEDKNISIKAFIDNVGKPLGEQQLSNTPGTLLKAPTTAVHENGVRTEKAVPAGGLQLDDKAMKAVQKSIDNQLKGVGNIADEWSGVASAIGAVGNAMAGIEDPAAKVLGIVAQAIATVALTFSKSLAGTVTPWDWIAAAAAGTATMISTISAIHSATGYAEGGMIKGNSYSGDNLMAMGPNGLIGLNAGEIVLNKSQQATLAQNLQGSGMQNLNLTATIKGEQIRLALNNNGRRTGRGEYVQSRNVR